MNDNLMQAVDAFSASPAIRLRYQFLAAKGRQLDDPCFPPTIEHLPEHQFQPPYDAVAAAARDRSPLAMLIRLRRQAADQIEHLLAFLDATEGGFEDVLDGDEDAAVDDAGCDEDFEREPSLGFLEPVLTGQEHDYWFPTHSDDARQDIAQGATDDREADDSDLEPSLCGITVNAEGDGSDFEGGDAGDDDIEPSLGSLSSCWGGGDQTIWASGAPADLEDSGIGNGDREHDDLDVGEVDDSDKEPSLGWTVDGAAGSQTGEDRELQEHATADVKNDRARRTKGKRRPRSISLEPSFVGTKSVSNLTERQYALVEPRLDFGTSAFRSPTLKSRGLR